MLRCTLALMSIARCRVPLGSSSTIPATSSSSHSDNDLSFRCRAGDKLAEIDDQFHLFSNPNFVRVVLDLAAAPGSFTQVAVKRMQQAQSSSSSSSLSEHGRVDPLAIAVDLQKMQPMPHCHTLRCNVLDHARIRKELHRILTAERHARRKALDGDFTLFHAPQVVLHDGVSVVDGQSELSVTYSQTNMAMGSLKLAAELFSQEARRVSISTTKSGRRQTSNDWAFVTKLMPSVHFNKILTQARRHFRAVDVVRPLACREDSKERYLVCKDFFTASTNKQGRSPTVIGSSIDCGFSLPPSRDDVGGSYSGRQVMWHCFGCGRSQLGAKGCQQCNNRGNKRSRISTA
jgi:23S rRNA U2552 (ribose-2'-O)-methylase RlmE/FtsJ